MEESVKWILAAVGTAGGLIATGWGWFERQKRKKQDAQGMSYRELFRELKKDLQTVQNGFKELQEEHSQCQMKLARMEERMSHVETQRDEANGKIEELEAEVAKMREAAP